ncbi:MAG: LLM class F420-dependent oxidoreductase [Microbacteriaceae bacterium]
MGPIGVWTSALDHVPASEARERAAELEALGFGTLWLPEVAGRDPFAHAALLLASTSTLVVATGIANIWARDAIAMNSGHRTLTEAFPERFVLGLGVSHQPLVAGLRGHDYRNPLQAMRAYLDAMDSAPFTARRPSTPPRRMLGALRGKMLRLAAERTDGAHPYFVPPEHTAWARGELGEEPLLCPEQAVVLETDPARARDLARTHLAFYFDLPNYMNNLRQFGIGEDDIADGGSDRLVDAIVAWGDEEAVARRIKEHIDAGANHVCVQVIADDRRTVPVDAWRRLAPVLCESAA